VTHGRSVSTATGMCIEPMKRVGFGILKRQRSSSWGGVVVLEIDPRLAGLLTERFQDPRLEVKCGSAEDLKSHLDGMTVDVVVSGLPFTSLKSDVRDRILEQVVQALAPEGVALVLQYTPIIQRQLRRLFPSVKRRAPRRARRSSAKPATSSATSPSACGAGKAKRTRRAFPAHIARQDRLPWSARMRPSARRSRSDDAESRRDVGCGLNTRPPHGDVRDPCAGTRCRVGEVVAQVWRDRGVRRPAHEPIRLPAMKGLREHLARRPRRPRGDFGEPQGSVDPSGEGE
jgi:hypothetical protein